MHARLYAKRAARAAAASAATIAQLPQMLSPLTSIQRVGGYQRRQSPNERNEQHKIYNARYCCLWLYFNSFYVEGGRGAIWEIHTHFDTFRRSVVTDAFVSAVAVATSQHTKKKNWQKFLSKLHNPAAMSAHLHFRHTHIFPQSVPRITDSLP